MDVPEVKVIFLFMLLHTPNTRPSPRGAVLGTIATKSWWISQWLETWPGSSDTFFRYGEQSQRCLPHMASFMRPNDPSCSCVVETQSHSFDTTRHRTASLMIFTYWIISPRVPNSLFSLLLLGPTLFQICPFHCLWLILLVAATRK